MPASILIVGAGVAGLTLARDLARAGVDVHVFERDDHVGGQVSTLAVDDHFLDAAAESFATRTSAVGDLIAELGMADRVVSPRDAAAWVYHSDEEAFALPATGLLGVPARPFAADVRRTLGVAGAARAWADRLLPRRVGAGAQSFGELVSARMGAAVTRRLVAPITRGVHSAEPEKIAVASAHPQLADLLARRGSLARAVRDVRALAPAGSAVASLRGGMRTLPIALAASAREAGATIHLGTEATNLTATSLSAAGRDWQGRVVLAAPPAGAPTRDITLVTLVVSAPSWQHAPRGTGVLVAREAPAVFARALTHVSAKWAWVATAFGSRQVVRLSYDGDVAHPREHAFNDAARLMGSVPDTVHTIAERRFSRALPHVPGNIIATGESVSGTGLAAVVAHARALAATIITENAASLASSSDAAPLASPSDSTPATTGEQ